MKKIYLSWFKLPYGRTNFGDELSPYIIKKLTGAKVVYMPYYERGLVKRLILYLKLLYSRRITVRGLIDLFGYFFDSNPFVLFGIGSIIRTNNYRRSIIWGSGIISRYEYIKDSVFIAVRGEYTQRRIAELGYDIPKVLGDPAILLPIVHKVEGLGKKFTLGIIPHFQHFDEVNSVNYEGEFKIINLEDPLEKVIADIISCEKTISSSLHGIIVSHAYGIPSLWVSLSNDPLAGDDIKFADYFSSVSIEEYSAIEKPEQYSSHLVESLFDNNRRVCLPPIGVISNQQNELLKCAPFEVLDIYKGRAL